MSNKQFCSIDGVIDNNFKNEKFIKLRLKVCHDGINKNNTYFAVENLESAENSIYLSPILARVIKDENGEYQFSGHDMNFTESEFEDGKTKIIYEEVPIGFIPTPCLANYQIEHIDDKNYVFVDGYIWKEYSNYAEEIIKRDKKINLSMEIEVRDCHETVLEDNTATLHITDFVYTGITLLGNDVEPAMYDACATLITFALENGIEKSVSNMKEELLKSILDEPTNKALVSNTTIDFSKGLLSNEQKTLQNLLNLKNDENSEYFLLKTFSDSNGDKYVYFWDLISKECFYQQYKIQEDTGLLTLISNPKKCFFENSDVKTKYESLSAKYEVLLSENEKLKMFKSKILSEMELAKKTEELLHWEKLLSSCNEFADLKANIDQFTLEELSMQCKCIFADLQLKKIDQKTKIVDSNNMVSFNLSRNLDEPLKSNTDLFIEKFKKY